MSRPSFHLRAREGTTEIEYVSPLAKAQFLSARA